MTLSEYFSVNTYTTYRIPFHKGVQYLKFSAYLIMFCWDFISSWTVGYHQYFFTVLIQNNGYFYMEKQVSRHSLLYHIFLRLYRKRNCRDTDLPTLKNKNSYFDIQKFVFCTKKSYFFKLISQNAFWSFILYYMYFSYGKWMQEGLPNLTGSCHLAREWKIIKVLRNKKT